VGPPPPPPRLPAGAPPGGAGRGSASTPLGPGFGAGSAAAPPGVAGGNEKPRRGRGWTAASAGQSGAGRDTFDPFLTAERPSSRPERSGAAPNAARRPRPAPFHRGNRSARRKGASGGGSSGKRRRKAGREKSPLLVPVVPHLRRWERSPRDGRGAASPPLGGAGFPQPPPPGTRPTDGRPRAARPRGKTARLLLQNGRSARDAARGAPPQRERGAGNAARPRPPHRLQRCCRARLGAERGWRLADATCSIYRCLRAKGGSKFLTVRTEKPAGSGYGCHTGTAEPSRSNRSAF